MKMITCISLMFILKLIETSQSSNTIGTLQCKEGETFKENSCVPCSDQCQMCMNDQSLSCLQCKIGFTLVNGKCGKECSTFKYCDMCSVDLTECIHCAHKCSLKDGQCSCTSRIIIIIVCVLVSLLIVGSILYCLTKPSGLLRKKAIIPKPPISTNPIVNHYQINQRQQETAQINVNLTTSPSNRVNPNDENTIEDQFNFNKIEVGDVSDKQLCDQCKDQVGNVKLSCGCCLCDEHGKVFEKLTEKGKHCPICLKEVTSSNQITCGICFQIKAVLSKFSCQCSLLICKDCFVNTKLTNKSCPACRAII